MSEAPKTPDSTPRFSLERLSSAFARLMGSPPAGATRPQIAVDASAEDADLDDGEKPLAVTPRMIVEGLLFVGRRDGRPLTARELAAPIRDVEPADIEPLVVELNDLYRQEGAPYEIAAAEGGYRLQLREASGAIRQRMRGEDRPARLSPAAVEVLSVVAYRQPITSAAVNHVRHARSQPILAQLVRRQLLRVDRPGAAGGAVYRTTDRFNRLFGISSPAELPRSEDLDDA